MRRGPCEQGARHATSLDKMRITRRGDEAVRVRRREGLDDYFKLGPGVRYMTDGWNECVLVRERGLPPGCAEYERLDRNCPNLRIQPTPFDRRRRQKC